MNILVIPSWYNSPSNIILGSFFKEQALALKNDGNNVVMAYCETVGVRGFSTHHLYSIKNLNVQPLLMTDFLNGYCLNIKLILFMSIHMIQQERLLPNYVIDTAFLLSIQNTTVMFWVN